MIAARTSMLCALLVGAPSAQEPAERSIEDQLQAVRTAKWRTRAAALRSLGDRSLHMEARPRIDAVREGLTELWKEGGSYDPWGRPPSLNRYEHLRALQRIALADRLAAERNPVDAAIELLTAALGDHEDLQVRREQAVAVLPRITPRGYQLRRNQYHTLVDAQVKDPAPFAVAAAAEWLGANAWRERAWVELVAEALAAEPICAMSPYVVEAERGRVLWQDEIRFALARALLAGARSPEDRWLALQHLVYSPLREEQTAAIHELASSDADPQLKLERLAEVARRGELEVVREVITAFGLLGKDAEPMVPELERLVLHSDPQIAERAEAALRQIRG